MDASRAKCPVPICTWSVDAKKNDLQDILRCCLALHDHLAMTHQLAEEEAHLISTNWAKPLLKTAK